jgi:hypothetical protein
MRGTMKIKLILLAVLGAGLFAGAALAQDGGIESGINTIKEKADTQSGTAQTGVTGAAQTDLTEGSAQNFSETGIIGQSSRKQTNSGMGDETEEIDSGTNNQGMSDSGAYETGGINSRIQNVGLDREGQKESGQGDRNSMDY